MRSLNPANFRSKCLPHLVGDLPDACQHRTAHDWHDMAGLVTGFVQMQATTDIDHLPLKHVFASALLTKQYEDIAEKETLVRKPVVVQRADGNGVVIIG